MVGLEPGRSHSQDHQRGGSAGSQQLVAQADTANPILAAQRTIGNQAVQRQIARGALPPRLILGQQQTLGNQAVQRLLRDQSPQPPATPEPTATVVTPGAGPAVQRQDREERYPRVAYAPTEDEATLRRALDQAVQRGLELAIYTSHAGFDDASTFEAAARSFSRDHQAVGLVGGRLVIGEQAAMPARTVDEVVRHVQATVEKVRRELGRAVTASTLALFTHGLTDYLNWGDPEEIATTEERARELNAGGQEDGGAGEGGAVNPVQTAPGFAAAIDSALSGTARVVMYACLTGGTYTQADLTGQDAAGAALPAWRQRQGRQRVRDDHATGGEGSFADALRDALVVDGQGREVWGHRSAAHTTANPRWREFEGPQEGEQASEELFGGPEQIHADRVRRQLVREIRAQVRRDSGRVISDAGDALSEWVAREMPFVPDGMRPFATWLGGERYDLAAGLVAWFAARYVQHHPAE
jgi:hypothetical protein